MPQKRSPSAPGYAGGRPMTKTEAILLAWMVVGLFVVIILLRQ
ncbi:MAG: hypothetical protein WCD69_17585 [Xanthobacteraceae bacterium]